MRSSYRAQLRACGHGPGLGAGGGPRGASAHRRAREDLRAFRNAAMVLLYSKLAPKRRCNRPLPWDAPTVATLSQCFALSERRVREILETVDERAATELIDGMRRQRRPRRSQIDMDGPAEIQLPGEF